MTTTANDGYNGGSGGKLRKKKVLRKTTPYDRPLTSIGNPNPNNTWKSGFLSRLIYAGADRLLCAFRKRNPALTAPPVTGTNEEQGNEHQVEGPNFGLKTNTGASEPNTNDGGNLANISSATEISDLETMLKQKTFTRSEIERLTALLNSRTTTSDVSEGDKADIFKNSHGLRLAASTSGSLNKHVSERENFHAVISTPVVNSRVFEEDVASPAELAKAYMGTRPAEASPSTLRLNNTTILPRTPYTSLAPRTAGSLKGVENAMTTPRSRGRSALYSMARSPYYRGPSTLSKKPMSSLVSSQPAWGIEGSSGSKMAGKRRSSVIDDLGTYGPIRRIRQKANLYSQGSSLKRKSEFDSSNEPEQKASKAIVENGETSKRNAVVPTESTQMASKIFEHLERMSPKEKPSSSRLAGTTEKSATNLTSNLALGNNQESAGPHRIEENVSKQFAVPLNVLSSMNWNSTAPTPTTNGDSALPAEPPQTKHAFQMSALEDYQVLDDDSHSNGHVSVPLGENTKPETSLLVDNNVSAVAPTEVLQTPAATPNVVSPPKINPGSPSGSVVNKSTEISQPISVGDTVSPQKKPTFLPAYGASTKSAEVSPLSPQKKPTFLPTYGLSTKSAEVSPFSFAAKDKDVSGVKQNISLTDNTSITNGTASPVLPSSTPAPVFKSASAFASVSATASLTPAIVSPSVTEAPDTSATKDKEPKSNIFSSLTFPSTSISSPATLTTNSNIFGLQTNTQASSTATQAAPFTFGSASTVIPSSTSVVSFGLGSSVASSEIKSGSFTSGFTTSNFGSGFGSPPFSFGAPSKSTPSTTSSPIVFNAGASTASAMFSFNAGSAANPFSQASCGTPAASLDNNDEMTMEDSMHEDPIQTPSPATPVFAFNSGTPTPSPSPSVPFQTNQPPSYNPFQPQTNQPTSYNPFQGQTNQTSAPNPFQGQTNQTPAPNPFQGQTNQTPAPNPFQGHTNQTPAPNPFIVQTNQTPAPNLFQASGEFNAGGSFSLGSGGGDKSGRRTVKPSRIKNRKK